MFKTFIFLTLKDGVKALLLHFLAHFIDVGIESVVFESVFVGV